MVGTYELQAERVREVDQRTAHEKWVLGARRGSEIETREPVSGPTHADQVAGCG